MTSTSTTAILASDFSDRTTDTDRRDWTIGKLAHVIAALNGTPVAITVERQTGHTEIGVQLIRVFHGGPARGPRVTVRRTLSDGTTQDTNFHVWTIGEAIIPLDRPEGRGAKWDALDTWRKQKSEAVRIAQAEHGESEGRAWGSWTARPIDATEVSVSYEPSTGNDAFADKWGTRWYGTVAVPIPAKAE